MRAFARGRIPEPIEQGKTSGAILAGGPVVDRVRRRQPVRSVDRAAARAAARVRIGFLFRLWCLLIFVLLLSGNISEWSSLKLMLNIVGCQTH